MHAGGGEKDRSVSIGDKRGARNHGVAMFLEKFKLYRDPATYSANPGKLNTIMPKAQFANLDDFDIKAIYRYLHTLPAVNNLVEKYPK